MFFHHIISIAQYIQSVVVRVVVHNLRPPTATQVNSRRDRAVQVLFKELERKRRVYRRLIPKQNV